MAIWLQETIAAAGMLLFIVSALVLSAAGGALFA